MLKDFSFLLRAQSYKQRGGVSKREKKRGLRTEPPLNGLTFINVGQCELLLHGAHVLPLLPDRLERTETYFVQRKLSSPGHVFRHRIFSYLLYMLYGGHDRGHVRHLCQQRHGAQ